MADATDVSPSGNADDAISEPSADPSGDAAPTAAGGDDPAAPQGGESTSGSAGGVDVADGGPLEGQVAWVSWSPWVTALAAATGVLLLRALAILLARVALGLRRPATIVLTERGLEAVLRTELLGRTLRERRVFYPIDNVVSITREVRFARAGTYAGLLALVVGTYVGVSLLTDGVRAPGTSPTLIGLGVAAIALGLALDFALTTVLDSARKRVRLVLRAKRGPSLCIGQLAEGPTDALLARVAAADRPES